MRGEPFVKRCIEDVNNQKISQSTLDIKKLTRQQFKLPEGVIRLDEVSAGALVDAE
mgnify:CR=1 FL=1